MIDLTKVQKIQEVFDQESNVNPAKDWIWNQTVGYFEVSKPHDLQAQSYNHDVTHAFQKDFTIFYPQVVSP